MKPLLVLVVDRAGLGGGELPARVAALVDAGVDRLQLRDRALEADALFALTCAALEGARAATRPAQVIVNRRIDVALAAGADGVHLGFDALDVAEARALMGAAASIGVSCHSIDEVRAAADAGADLVHLAPVFDPISKAAERPSLGLGVLGDACAKNAGRAAAFDVIAQGGLDATRAAAVIAAGAHGIAVTGTITGAADPKAAVAALRRALDAG